MRAKRVSHTLKPGVAGAEVVLLLVARAVRNVRLAIDAEHAAIRIEDRDRVEVRMPGALEEADRQHHAELARDRLEVRERRDSARAAARDCRCRTSCSMQKYGVSNSSGSRMICAPCFAASRTARFGLRDVAIDVPVAGELRRGDRDRPGRAAEMLGLHGNRLIGRKSCTRTSLPGGHVTVPAPG